MARIKGKRQTGAHPVEAPGAAAHAAQPSGTAGGAALGTDVEGLLKRIVEGNRRALSRCISWVENDPASALLVDAADRLGRDAMVVGVTGVPGAGKSTLVPALARRFAAAGSRPAIVAVDPSSPLTGGAILGDRIRDTGSDGPPIFFRSVASRGSLGGLSHTLYDVVTLLEAAGFDVILIETVGTGQSEVAVAELAHTTVVTTAPGLGDDIQAMKAGILEVADLIVVNKADIDPRGAEAAVQTLRSSLALAQRAHGLSEGANSAAGAETMKWHPPARAVSARRGDGLDELCEQISRHRDFLQRSGRLDAWRRRRRLTRFRESLRRQIEERVSALHADLLAAAENDVASGLRSPIAEAAVMAARLVPPRRAGETGSGAPVGKTNQNEGPGRGGQSRSARHVMRQRGQER